MSNIEISVSQEEQEAASQIVREAGSTLDEVLQQLIRHIVREQNVPLELLNSEKPAEGINKEAREEDAWDKKIAAIQAHRKGAVIGPPITIEEIISARDEGRRY